MLGRARHVFGAFARGNASRSGARQASSASKSSGAKLQSLDSGEDLAPFMEVFPGVVAGLVVAYGMFSLVRDYKIFGGDVPATLTEEWSLAEEALSEAKPREGAPDKPVVINPIRKGYVPS